MAKSDTTNPELLALVGDEGITFTLNPAMQKMLADADRNAAEGKTVSGQPMQPSPLPATRTEFLDLSPWLGGMDATECEALAPYLGDLVLAYMDEVDPTFRNDVLVDVANALDAQPSIVYDSKAGWELINGIVRGLIQQRIKTLPEQVQDVSRGRYQPRGLVEWMGRWAWAVVDGYTIWDSINEQGIAEANPHL